MRPRLFDAHNHLQAFAGRPDFDALLRDTREAGVVGMVVNATGEADWDAVAALARRFSDLILPAFGVHPWHLAERTPRWRERLESLLKEFPNAVVGEIGLDRAIRDAGTEVQCRVFLEQWRLAVALNRPVEVHCVKATGLLQTLLRDEPKPARGWVLHGYAGPAEAVASFVRLGASFSFCAGGMSPEKTTKRAEAFRRVPPERLLIETDAPHMAPPGELRRFPSPQRADGKPENHPGHLVVAAEELARILGRTPEQIVEISESNVRRMFGV